MLLQPSRIGRFWAPCRLLRAHGVLTAGRSSWHAPIRSAMSLAKVDEALYGQQLSAKADRLKSKFADFCLPVLEVFDSQTEHYRMRSALNPDGPYHSISTHSITQLSDLTDCCPPWMQD